MKEIAMGKLFRGLGKSWLAIFVVIMILDDLVIGGVILASILWR